MAFFTIQRNGFTTVSQLIHTAIQDMTDHGFSVVFPVGYNPATPLPAPFKVILAAGPDVDPLSTTQGWRVCFQVTADQTCAAFVGTSFQIQDDGTLSTLSGSGGATLGWAGQVGKLSSSISSDPEVGFINRATRVSSNSNGTFPMSSRLSISSRGFFLGAFEGSWANGIFDPNAGASYFNWLLVQRPVDKSTGAILTTGKAPLFCVNKVDNLYWRFVVRESDVPHPTPAVNAAAHTPDNFRLINIENQVSVAEEKTYLISFMNSLNTPRFRYTQELDMLGIVSADVVMEGVAVPLSVYGGSKTYTALPGSSSYNSGVRVMVITADS